MVEVDTKYIKGMLNNPDIQPNAAIKRWIAGILTFDFKLKHIPTDRHQGTDGLSKRRRAEEADKEEEETEDEVEDWIDEVLGCTVWISKELEEGRIGLGSQKGEGREGAFVLSAATSEMKDNEPAIPMCNKTVQRNKELLNIYTFLDTLAIPPHISDTLHSQFIKRASEFFSKGGRLWRKDLNSHHQLILFTPDRLRILQSTNDELGHKCFYATQHTIVDRFWWPSLNNNLTWYLKTCHQCQTHSIEKVVIPPTITVPAPLFRKAYVDSMHIPTAYRYSYIVQVHCSLTRWPEWRMLKKETGQTIGAFLFEEILCQ